MCFWCTFFIFLGAHVLCFLVLVVSTSAVDCLERLVSEMTYYVSSGTLNLYSTLLMGLWEWQIETGHVGDVGNDFTGRNGSWRQWLTMGHEFKLND